MQLTTVLALVCFAQTVLSAPAVDPRHAAKVNAASKNTLSDSLELELQGVHQQNQPISEHGENEAVISNEEKEIVDNYVEPEVKRSERVSAEDVDSHGEDLDGLSDNLEAADQDVKSVLRVFLHSLKQHPEIVEDIMEKEGEKLLGHPLADDSDNSEPSAFQEPSPQLTKIPKQVEKKAGGEFPRFIYKSPMRNAFERNQMTAGSINNDARPPVQPSHNNEVPVAESPLVDPHDVSDVKATDADLSNAIPVIQQPNANQDTLEDQRHILPDQPEQSGPIDITALQQAQDEYSRENPFINSLPIFPEHKEQQESQVEDIVEADQEQPHVQPLDSDAPEDDVPHLQDTEIVNTDLAPEEESDVIKEGGESEEKRSQDVLKSGEEGKEADTLVKSEEEDDETDSMPTEAAVEESVQDSPKTKPPHHLTGSEIAANMLHNPVESESSVPYYYYYYDYNKDGGRVPGGKLAASEEGEHEQEENISDENRPTEVETETDEEEGDEEEHSQEDSEEAEEEETDGDDESDDESEDVDEENQEGDEDPGDDTEEDEAQEGDEEGEEEDSDKEEEENDLDEEEEEGHDEEDEGKEEEEEVEDESDESTDRTNSHKVIAVNDYSQPDPTKQRVLMKQPLEGDKNEADLLSLKAETRGASNRPDGPAM